MLQKIGDIVTNLTGRSDTFTPDAVAASASPNSGATPDVSSIVYACVQTFSTAFIEAPIRVQHRDADGSLTVVPNHPITKLFANPNPYYSGLLMQMALIADWLFGNAYLQKVTRNGVMELYWIPSVLMEPYSPPGGGTFTQYYIYRPGYGQKPVHLPTSSVIHFRNGLDARDVRLGRSPLRAMMAEIMTDAEALVFTLTILQNLGVPGTVISPASTGVNLSPSDADKIKMQYMDRVTGTRRGEPLVLTAPVTIHNLDVNMEDINLRSIRIIPEERICAIIGVPPIVAGLGAGLEHATYSNYGEAREQFTEQRIIPTQHLIDADISTQLLPDFETRPDEFVVDRDLSNVRVLQEDQNALVDRLGRQLTTSQITINEARISSGLQPVDGGDVFLLPVSMVPTDLGAVSDATIEQRMARVVRQIRAPKLATNGADRRASGRPFDADCSCRVSRDPTNTHLCNSNGMRIIESSTECTRCNSNGMRELKIAPETFANRIVRIRGRMFGPCQDDVYNELRDTMNTVLDQLRDAGKQLSAEDVSLIEDIMPTETELTIGMRDILRPWYIRMLTAVHDLTVDALDIEFELDDPMTARYMASCGTQIQNISQTTLAALRKELVEGFAEHESYQQLAARLRNNFAFGRSRANTVARTELGQSSNKATIENYTASRVVKGVLVIDGDDYDDECISINGQRFLLEDSWQIPALEHPNCRRCFSPLTTWEG